MSNIQFKAQVVTASIRNPMKNFDITEETVEIRTDPLTGQNIRISKAKGLDKTPADDPLTQFVNDASPCFFCKGKVENQTPMMPSSIYDKGRIEYGEAYLFPNLSGFGKYSAVCIFSKNHFTAVNGFSESQIFHVLKASQEYFKLCSLSDAGVLYPSINFNYLLPAGSSILHPHMQPFLDPVPTNMHKLILTSGENFFNQHQCHYWEELKSVEKSGSRFLYETGKLFWFTPFAPVGFNEINSIIGHGESYIELTDSDLIELARGINRVLHYYYKIQRNSLNMTLFSPPVNVKTAKGKTPCLLKIATRPAFMPFYRNEVTFFEKFHHEIMLDQFPEQTAEQFNNHFNDLLLSW